MHRKRRGTGAPLVPERIQQAILLLRGHKVVLDFDLAGLYGVETKVVNKAVKRKSCAFPRRLHVRAERRGVRELEVPICHLEMGRPEMPPYAFTEQGAAMLSSVLRSARAVNVNIEIMRVFVRLRAMLSSNEDLARKLTALEKKYDAQFKAVFDATRELMMPPQPERRPIGFGTGR